MVTATTDPSDVAAFFDLDKTLITVNSGKLWLQREFRVGRIGLGTLLRGFVYLGMYTFGIIDMDRVMQRGLETVVGLDEELVDRWTREWFQTEVVPHVAPGARQVVESHRAQGHRLVLLTSSSPYASKCAVELFGLDDALSMVYVVEDGRFTGEIVRPACYGSGKVVHARAFAERVGIDLAKSYFYSDSISDLPMLEAVGFPQVVHPDPRLAREARRRHWPVLDWHDAP